MKRRVSLLLALGLIAALVLGGCGKKDDSASLVGEWQATLEMANTLNESLASDPTMADYIKIDSFAMKMDLSLRDDGTFTLALNEASVNEAFEGIKAPLKDGITAYMEASLEGTGMSVEDALAASGMDIDSMMDSMLSPEMITASLGDATESGSYVAKDGKLYFLDEGETKPGDDSAAMPYTLSGSKLTLDKPSSGDVGDLAEFFPMEFAKK